MICIPYEIRFDCRVGQTSISMKIETPASDIHAAVVREVVLRALVIAKERVESAIARRVFAFVEAQVPLADCVRFVAALLETLRQKRFVEGNAVGFVEQNDVVLHSVVNWISNYIN